MNEQQSEALLAHLRDALAMPVIWGRAPTGDDALVPRPPRPYIAVLPTIETDIGLPQRYFDGAEETVVQDYEVQWTFQVMHHTDNEATRLARTVHLIMSAGSTQLLFQAENFAYLRRAGLVDNTQVRHESWNGRADLDLVFMSSASYTEAREFISSLSILLDMRQPDVEETVTIEEPENGA